MKRTLLFALALIAVAPSSALSQRHNVLGTTTEDGEGWGWDDGVMEIISDIEISGLHVRRVRRSHNTECPFQNIDHIEMSGPINPDTPEVIGRLIDRIKQDPTICRHGSAATGILMYSVYVYLASGGGYLEDGFRLGELLREEFVTTIVPPTGECYSSCAAAFLGGKFRHMNGQSTGEQSALSFHAPYRYLNRFDIVCDSSSRRLRTYFREMLNRKDGQFLYERTMSYCSNRSGWTLNPDAAELFNITTGSPTGRVSPPPSRSAIPRDLVAGERDGPFETYYENGQLWGKGTYVAGEEDGPWESYYENGQLKWKGTYNMGKRCGEWIEEKAGFFAGFFGGRTAVTVTLPPC